MVLLDAMPGLLVLGGGPMLRETDETKQGPERRKPTETENKNLTLNVKS